MCIIYDNPDVQLYTIQPDPAFATNAFQMPLVASLLRHLRFHRLKFFHVTTSSGQMAMGHPKMCTFISGSFLDTIHITGSFLG